MKKRICHMTSVHKPNDDRIVLKECVSILNAGYEVSLVYLGDLEEIIDRRIKYVCAGKYLTSRLNRMMIGAWKVFQAARKTNSEVYHFHDPELIPMGILLKILGKKVIYDVHEDLPRQIMSKEWVPAFLRRSLSIIIKCIEKIADYLFDGIIVVLPTIQKRFLKSHCICIYNYPLKEELRSDTEWNNRKPVFGYAGGLTKIRCVNEMVEAIQSTDYNLYLAGDFENDMLKEKVLKAEKVFYKGYLSRGQIKCFYSEIFCGLVLFYPVPNHIYSQPVKMKEYMAAGIPIIASNFPEWIKFIKKYNCGICVDPLNINEIVMAMDWIIKNPEKAKEMGENGMRAIEQEFSWEKQEKELMSFYENIL